ncbi:glycerate-2-kinase family protein [Massilia sp. Dwa41.01b]|uniref:glycerate-2-kinase family protein n=1 Tax=Massilia sp. Dwa41.01b TaxID=2709302 RepID=UPI001E54C5C4|nr:glycerate-2-kinase family protein [Massilia sp. Dwa41.01b]
MARHLPPPPRGRTVVVGAGKAAARMAEGVERVRGGGAVGAVGPGGDDATDTARRRGISRWSRPAIRCRTRSGLAAAERMLALVSSLSADDLVLCLVSGGGSALLSLPAPGITVEEKRAIHRALLRSGAPIGEMNCVRRHLSAIKGGRLALACHPARVVTLIVSDVPGDDPATVASGPTVPDSSRPADALAILERYAIAVPDAVRAHLANPSHAAPCRTILAWQATKCASSPPPRTRWKRRRPRRVPPASRR